MTGVLLYFVSHFFYENEKQKPWTLFFGNFLWKWKTQGKNWNPE